MQYTKLKFIPTGNVFNLPTKDAKEILKDDRGNFIVVGGTKIPDKKNEVIQTSTYELVVNEEKNEQSENINNQEADKQNNKEQSVE